MFSRRRGIFGIRSLSFILSMRASARSTNCLILRNLQTSSSLARFLTVAASDQPTMNDLSCMLSSRNRLEGNAKDNPCAAQLSVLRHNLSATGEAANCPERAAALRRIWVSLSVTSILPTAAEN